MGELVGIYDKAGYAIQKAEKISGVVISSEQAYVWEKETGIWCILLKML